MKNIALIIAGGVGARMHQDIPKQFIHVHDRGWDYQWGIWCKNLTVLFC